MRKRIIIIGLDGVPYSLIRTLTVTGVMPNTGEIISRGIFSRMRSSIPEISSVAWSSIITGANPGEHGIFGFTDLLPDSYNLRFSNFSDLKIPPFWTEIDGRSTLINIPSTYPVREMNGIHISGFISIDFEKSVYPRSMIPELKELDYRLDVDSEKAHKSYDLFLSDLDRTLKTRIETYRHLWNREDWKLFALIFTGTDKLMHFLWDSYEDGSHRYHKDFLEHFHKIDEVIGEISKDLGEDDLLAIFSDHGFEKLDRDIYINSHLKKEGFLKFSGGKEPGLGDIISNTKAFALDPARIYINLKGKYPSGSVDVNDRGKILKDLQDLFDSLKVNGRKLIRDTYRKEDIYSGPSLDQAADLILVGNQGFNLRASIKPDKLEDKPIFTGKHTQDDGFFLLAGPVERSVMPENLAVTDVRKIIGL